MTTAGHRENRWSRRRRPAPRAARALGAALLGVCVATVPAAAGPLPCALDPTGCQLPDQMGHGLASALGATSDANPEADPNDTDGLAVRENLVVPDGGVINEVCWWGFYVQLDPAGDCGPGAVADSFTVTYFNNVEGFPGMPGTVKAGPFDVTSTLVKAETGNVLSSEIGDLTEFEFSATHPDVLVDPGECVWIRIQNDTTGSDPPCFWLWSTAPSVAEGGIGDGVSFQDEVEQDFDLAFCVNLPLGDPTGCNLPVNSGCLGATNPCDETSPDPGCADPECCTLVCEPLPFCCINAWDANCVLGASELCVQCGDSDSGNCFAANFTPFCDDFCGQEECPGCCDLVCAVDPACCEEETAWDGFCAFEAQQLCLCDPAEIPLNDECPSAVAVTLGDTSIDNTCATAGPPDHETCNDGSLGGLGLDVWFSYTAGFTGELLVSTCNQASFDTQLAVYEGCDCGALEDPPLGCNDDGPVCAGGTSLVVVSVVEGTCYLIRVGSGATGPSGSGTLTLSQDVPAPCSITIPPEAVAEGEPCGADANGGCDNAPDPPVFVPVQDGDVIHGTAWANGGVRDTDWYEITLAEETEVSLILEAEFPFVVGFAETDPPGSGDCADHTGFIDPAASGTACTENTVTALLPPGTWWPFVAPAQADGVPCGGGSVGNDYVLTVTSQLPCPWDCGDGDGTVGTPDFLALLSAWGTAGGPCDFGAGDPGVGVSEFLELLANWGPCP